jgi:hypothetical protein
MDDYIDAYIVNFYTEGGATTAHFGKAQEWHEQDKENVHATLSINGETKKTGRITCFYRTNDFKVMIIHVGKKHYTLFTRRPVLKTLYLKTPTFVIDGKPSEKSLSLKALQRVVEKKQKLQVRYSPGSTDICTSAYIKDVNPETKTLTSITGQMYKLI